MNYRFLKVTSYYASFFDYFYLKYPDDQSKTFAEHLNLMLNERFGWGNYFKINLEKLGNETNKIIYKANSFKTK